MHSATCIAPVNIAVVKYWGKRDEGLILPYNDSISGTLSMDQMRAKTTVAASATFVSDRFWLNRVEKDVTAVRMQNVLRAMKELASKQHPDSELPKMHVHIASENNFPTAAGLASSAAGFACLVYTLAELYGIKNVDLTAIARQGSGSACRSIDGGFVHWQKGDLSTGDDSVAVQLATEEHWPEMRVVVCVVTDVQKKVASSSGMANTVQTSALYRHRIAECVDGRVTEIKVAIAAKDFERFANATMQDSNQFHAVCQDTYPPIKYMNDVSHQIVALVHHYNAFKKATKVAYTFDAGPNACLYMLDDDLTSFMSLLMLAFPTNRSRSPSYVRGQSVSYLPNPPENLFGYVSENNATELLRYIIVTKLGTGATRINDSAALLSAQGFPLPPPSIIQLNESECHVLLRFVGQRPAVGRAADHTPRIIVIKNEDKLKYQDELAATSAALDTKADIKQQADDASNGNVSKEASIAYDYHVLHEGDV